MMLTINSKKIILTTDPREKNKTNNNCKYELLVFNNCYAKYICDYDDDDDDDEDDDDDAGGGGVGGGGDDEYMKFICIRMGCLKIRIPQDTDVSANYTS